MGRQAGAAPQPKDASALGEPRPPGFCSWPAAGKAAGPRVPLVYVKSPGPAQCLPSSAISLPWVLLSLLGVGGVLSSVPAASRQASHCRGTRGGFGEWWPRYRNAGHHGDAAWEQQPWCFSRGLCPTLVLLGFCGKEERKMDCKKSLKGCMG